MTRHSDNDYNHDLKDAVQSAIYKELKDSALGINVSARNNIVSLWGMVDVLAEKITAEQIAKRIPGVRDVDNGLTVAMDNFIPDKDITVLVLEKFERFADEDIRKLGAHTKDGIVYLQGHAPTLKVVSEAELIAAQVRGVKGVKSQIKVGEEFDYDDATITNAVERAFANSEFIDERKVTTSTENGVVKLKGMLDNINDIEAAVEIASGVAGVKAVNSQISARHGITEGDRALTNELRDMLSKEEHLSRGTIRAFVVNRMAFLSGEVFDPDDKHRAEEVTRQLQGLTGISNDIQVSAHNL